MAGITRFEEIKGWKTARKLTNTVYELGNRTGFNRDFGLPDQIRRASVSTAKFITYLQSNPRQRRVSDHDSNYEV